MDEKPSLWFQFEKLIDLHKFYFEHLIRAAAFSFGIVGAILTYVIDAKYKHNETLKWALAFPLLISIGTFIIFYLGVWKTIDFTYHVKRLQKKLDIGWRPHSGILIWMCGVFAALFLILSVVILLLVIEFIELPTPPANK